MNIDICFDTSAYLYIYIFVNFITMDKSSEFTRSRLFNDNK